MILPPEARPLLAALAPGFTRPTFGRFAVLLSAAILTQGRHTVVNLLRTLGSLAIGHRTDYQRVSRGPPGRAWPWAAPWPATSCSISARPTR